MKYFRNFRRAFLDLSPKFRYASSSRLLLMSLKQETGAKNMKSIHKALNAALCLMVWTVTADLLAADGELDKTFGNGGKVITDIGAACFEAALGIQPDGKIVVAGRDRGLYPSEDFGVERYNSDGSPDTTFGNGGKVTTDFGGTDSATALGIQT